MHEVEKDYTANEKDYTDHMEKDYTEPVVVIINVNVKEKNRLLGRRNV